jgi:uncharacterized lipoprotein YddW (UPF0748 family)
MHSETFSSTKRGCRRSTVKLFAAIVGLAAGIFPSTASIVRAEVPSPPREFRAAWIATVANIDWPTKKGLPTAQQKRELIRLFDEAVKLNLNAVILQIRPCADALYPSKLEPWSEYLTGTQGQAPEPFYDPLKFAVEEAHARGLQLHVWFNPYRVQNTDSKSEPALNHASVANKDIVRKYGNFLWFDPGEPEAVDHFIAVLTDAVKRYDLDGVHIDDYFYPYPINEDGKPVPFPDDESYARAQAAGETLGRDDWRRKNVDDLVRRMYESVKAVKPHVLVGISPFGIWRPNNPPGIQGLDQYNALYADARKWLREGWVDYFTPQLYWRIEGPQSYPKLLAWWHGENVQGRHLWPGNGAHNVRKSASVEPARNAWQAEELIKQIELTREIVPEGPGNVFFSMKCLVDNRDGLNDKLRKGVYANQALVPESPWLGKQTPAKPKVSAKRSSKGVAVELKPSKGPSPWLWVVRARSGEDWSIEIIPGAEKRAMIDGDGKVSEVAVSGVSRLGREGQIVNVDVK